MMTPISLSLVFCASVLFLLLCPSCSVKKLGNAVEGKDVNKNYFHTLHIPSLPPSNVCNRSSKVLNEGSFLEVLHKHGPCNPNRASTAPSLAEILRRDQLRVDSIYGRRSVNETKTRVRFHGVPGDSASAYFVVMGFGTPKKEVQLLFDTGSGVIWTQCKPCKPCYPKNIPAFNPTHSTSYAQASCSSPQCKVLLGDGGSCSSSKCNYEIRYVDNSSSNLVLAKEKLTIKSSGVKVFKNMYFGCGFQVAGDSSGESGVLGINRYPLSFTSQFAEKTKSNVIFSYCIPSTPDRTGYLTFGGHAHVPQADTVKFSPISKASKSSQHYDLEMTGISVGGRKLLPNASLFKISKVTIDSGTVLTQLPSNAYAVFRSAFREKMRRYEPVLQVGILDTCYNFTKHTSFAIPAITVFFQGGVEVDIDESGIMIAQEYFKSKVYCLAFSDGQEAIFGNAQQKKYTIVFDAGNERIGFAPNGCN